MARWDLGASQGQPDLLAEEEGEELEDLLDHPDPMESQDPLVAEECLELMVLLDLRVKQEIEALPDLLVSRVSLATLEGRALPVSKV